MQVLHGIRVLDLTRLLPGPYCTMMMADYGAEVTKIEAPTTGDYGRETEPIINGQSTRFLTLNRNKNSIQLNLKTIEGRNTLLDMCKQADVIMESFRPGVMKRLGLDYETVKEINPQIIYCSLTGYGQTGPYQNMAGHDLNYIATSGLVDITGNTDAPPAVPGVQIADIAGGALMALSGILMALVSRSQDGTGRYVDVSMMDGVMSLLGSVTHGYLAGGAEPERGNTRLTGQKACYGIYQTKDERYIAVAALEPKFWKNFCSRIGKEDWIDQLNGNADVQQSMKQELAHLFKTKTRDEWIEQLTIEETCVSPVLSVAESINNPQVQARQMIIETEHPALGKLLQTGFPIKFSGDAGQFRHHASDL
ncbi:CaiB/BaiF CoA transferase family protein [Geomicrobium sp. JSM 1781026]|uniref:CaiB/BaiF CoA transferase family protein n=1 Tax=Geomicrobium sp. JSM 1781026 TaxID=3344580 RepID=UPI0035C1C28C